MNTHTEIQQAMNLPQFFQTKEVNLNGYKMEEQFRKLLNRFSKTWEDIIEVRGKKNSLERFKVFYGDLLEKFQELCNEEKDSILNSSKPFKLMSKRCELEIPTLFLKPQDQEDFVELFFDYGVR